MTPTNKLQFNSLVFEPRSFGSGHYFHYASHVLHSLLENGLHPALLCSEDARNDKSFQEHITSDLLSSVRIIDSIPSQVSKLDSHKSRRQVVKRLFSHVSKENINALYIPTGDGILQTIGFMGGMRASKFPELIHFEGLMLNGRAGYPDISIAKYKALLSRFAASRAGCTRIHFVDPYGVPKHSHKSPTVGVIPEPVENNVEITKSEARQLLNLPDSAKIIGIVGKQDFRKGLDLFVNAVLLNKNLGNFTLLVSGQLNDNTHLELERLKQAKNRNIDVRILDGFLSDDQIVNSIIASDALALPYRTAHQSSGILLRAAIHGTPVVTSNLGFLGGFTNQYNAGHTTNIYNPSQFGDALCSVLDKPLVEWNASKFLREFHCESNFQNHWSWGLRSKDLGMHPEEPLFWQPQAS